MRRRGKTAAVLLTTAALAASGAEIAASKEKASTPIETPKVVKRNPASISARNLLRQIGGRILNIKANAPNVTVTSSIDLSFAQSTRSAVIDTGSSLEPGSNGRYALEASSSDIGRNGRLDRSDVDSIKISSGSYADGGPLVSLNLYHTGKRLMDDPFFRPLFANSFYVRGTLIDETGSRAHLLGSTNRNPSFIGEQLSKGEVAATGTAMSNIINEALSNQPTHTIEPPFDPIGKTG